MAAADPHRAIDAIWRIESALLAKLGRQDEARAEFEREASLTGNERERSLLLERAAACTRESSPQPR